jgi:hypothetical protein
MRRRVKDIPLYISSITEVAVVVLLLLVVAGKIGYTEQDC